MATLREYFVKNGASNLTLDETWDFQDEAGKVIGKVTARLHLDFEAYAQYVSFYIPEISGMELPEALALDRIPELLKATSERTLVEAGIGGREKPMEKCSAHRTGLHLFGAAGDAGSSGATQQRSRSHRTPAYFQKRGIHGRA